MSSPTAVLDHSLSTQSRATSVVTSGEMALYEEIHLASGGVPPRATLVLVHGVGEHLGRYPHIFQLFCNLGYRVIAYDQRGHGRSTGLRGHVDRFQDYVEDLHVVLRRAAESPEPIFLLGHSMGALVACHFLAAQRRDPKHFGDVTIQACALIGMPIKPVVEIPRLKKAMASIVGDLLPRLQFSSEIDASTVCRNEEVVRRYEADPLVNHVVTAGWYREFLRALETLEPSLEGVDVPVFFLHGSDDRIAHPDGSRVIFQAYPAAEKQLHIYEGCFHEVLNEDAHPGIVDEIDAWFRKTAQKEKRS